MVSLGGFKIRNQKGEDHSLSVDFRTAFTEQFAEAEARVFPMRLTYDRFTLGLKVDDKPLPGDADIRKTLADIRFLAANVEMDKDGSVASAKADLTRVPKASQSDLDDISDQVLQSLEVLSIPLPEKKVEGKDTWKAQRTFLIGSAVMAVPAQADLVYTYLGVQQRDGREVALIGIDGRVKGRRGDGLNVGGTVTGTAFVATATGVVVQANATIKADLDFVFARQPAKAMGTLSVSIKRPAPPPEKK
jgi:hypothetical protein